MESFIAESTRILALTFKCDDLDTLLKVLTILKHVDERESKASNLFLSLKRIVYTIMQYDVQIPRKCINQVAYNYYLMPQSNIECLNRIRHFLSLQFSDLPEAWAVLVNKATTIKYDIVPIQALQINIISKRIVFCNQLTSYYRETFAKKPVYLAYLDFCCYNFGISN